MLKRANVILLIYDLPRVEYSDAKRAEKFRKDIIKIGYVPVQKSVYAKVIHNRGITDQEVKRLRAIAPTKGDVNAFVMSLGEFKKMVHISGNEKNFNMSKFSDEIVEI